MKPSLRVLQHQHWHLLFLVVLLTGLYYFTEAFPDTLEGSYLNISTRVWFAIAVLSPIVHQVYVLLCWRIELLYSGISKRFGPKGFKGYKAGFAILILSRVVTLVLLALANAGTFTAYKLPLYGLAVILGIPAVYLFYSVKKYFGFDRAFGIDHFQPETMKDTPMVKGGIFKYTSNGMYWYGFLILYLPGLLLQSKAALLIAAFNHLYIWVHFYFTEKPDMDFIYGNKSA